MMRAPEHLRQALYRHRHRLLRLYRKFGLVGVGLSEKRVNGVPQGRIVLTLYVERKRPAAELSPEQRVDLDVELRSEVGPGDLDVKEIGVIRALGTDRVRPVEGGCSEGHRDITAGTGSVLVRSLKSMGRTLRVSNCHVYANSNRAALGDPIYQPGPYDGGTPPENIVGLLNDFVPIQFYSSDNLVDAAVRTTQPDELLMLRDLGTPVGMLARDDASFGMQVVKSGRTTGVTWGTIADLDLTVEVSYGPDGTAVFEDQILVTSLDAFSQGGDSGSAVMAQDTLGRLHWVGLLFAGSGDGRQTIANHAELVAAALGVEVVAGEPGEPPVPPPSKPGCLSTQNLIVAAIVAILAAAALIVLL